MFNSKCKYEPISIHDRDDEDDDDMNNDCKIRDLLKRTAHRRIIQRNITDIDTEDRHHTDVSDVELEEIHLNNEDAHNCHDYDMLVFLLTLDGNKRKVGIMNEWRIWEFKEKYFGDELKNGNNVRLIYRGKLLDDSVEINIYNIANNAFIHVSMTKNGDLQSGNKQLQLDLNDAHTNYDNFDDGMDDEAFARTLQQREMQMIGMRMSLPTNDVINEDGARVMDHERARREFLCGIFLGSVAGIWILIFLILAPRAYSRRFRLGVTLGVVINVMIQLSYGQPPTNDVNDTNDANTINESNPSELN